MRRIVRSRTFVTQLKELVAYGAMTYGAQLANAKLVLLESTIERHLAHFPGGKPVDPILGLHVYPIAKTPFMVLYDFDDVELRVHFVLLAGFELTNLDPKSAEW
jgi:hypothetical protein